MDKKAVIGLLRGLAQAPRNSQLEQRDLAERSIDAVISELERLSEEPDSWVSDNLIEGLAALQWGTYERAQRCAELSVAPTFRLIGSERWATTRALRAGLDAARSLSVNER